MNQSIKTICETLLQLTTRWEMYVTRRPLSKSASRNWQNRLSSILLKWWIMIADSHTHTHTQTHCHHILQVELKCANTAVNSSGDLMYCYKPKTSRKIFQGPKHFIFSEMIQCCFDNHSCVEDWTTMQHRVYTRSKWPHMSHCCQSEFTTIFTTNTLTI